MPNQPGRRVAREIANNDAVFSVFRQLIQNAKSNNAYALFTEYSLYGNAPELDSEAWGSRRTSWVPQPSQPPRDLQEG
jgi:hypothetical protein